MYQKVMRPLVMLQKAVMWVSRAMQRPDANIGSIWTILQMRAVSNAQHSTSLQTALPSTAVALLK